jgi:RNA methyltransferase, TrmH family
MHSVRALTITSRQNEWFKRFRAAAQKHEHEVIAEGRKQLADLIASGIEPIAVALSPDDSLALPPRTLRLHFAPDLVDAMSATDSSQGVVALFKRPAATLEDLATEGRPLVVLDGVQDPGNVGTIIRLAVAFDAAGVVLTEGCADPWGPKVIRASVGSVFNIPVVEAGSDAIVEYGRSKRLPLYATAMDGVDDPASIERASIIVFGSEARGVSEELLRRAQPVTIPMSKRVESLNVATAAAIILSRLYERSQE